MRRLLALLLLLPVAGCGGASHQQPGVPLGAKAAPKDKVAVQCPAGRATMGCAIARSQGLRSLPPLKVAGGKIPDVSSYQGCPNWTSVKIGGAVGGIAKAGEYVQDPSLRCNARGLQAARLWHAYYWFVRGWNCTSQAAAFAADVHAVDPGARVLILDAEVPAAHGQIPCMANVLHARGYVVVVYTGPGTWPGGGNGGLPLWVATYGSHPSFFNLWTTKPVAWQFTGDCYGPAPHSWPGIAGSCIDVSVDYGITRLGPQPGPPPVRCFGHGAQVHARVCRAPRARVGALNAEIRRVRSQLLRRACRRVVDSGPASFPRIHVIRGRNYRRQFCQRLFRIGRADHRAVDAAIARRY